MLPSLRLEDWRLLRIVDRLVFLRLEEGSIIVEFILSLRPELVRSWTGERYVGFELEHNSEYWS